VIMGTSASTYERGVRGCISRIAWCRSSTWNARASSGLIVMRGRQRDHLEPEARADAVDDLADLLVAIEERELLEHAQVRQLQAAQADRERTRPRRHEHLLHDRVKLELRVGGHRGVRAREGVEIRVTQLEGHRARLDAALARAPADPLAEAAQGRLD